MWSLALTLAFVGGSEFFGPTWQETGNDGAGSLPTTAEQTTGPLKIERIEGDLEGTWPGAPDFEDMYMIRVCEPAAFLASTAIGDGGSAAFDTQLWLFQPTSPTTARGKLANKDVSGGSTRSRILPVATDESMEMLDSPGIYYIAISGLNRIPVAPPGDIAGRIFFFDTPFEISSPDGQGGPLDVVGWIPGGGGQTGAYGIELDGIMTADFPFTSFDCNGNGRHDMCDIYYFETSDDINGDNIPDECQCIADVNGDGTVDVADLLAVIAAWGSFSGTFDLNGDGVVDTGDMLIVLGMWGDCR